METIGIFIMFGPVAIWFMVYLIRNMPTVTQHKNYMASMRAEQGASREAWLAEAPAPVLLTVQKVKDLASKISYLKV